MKFTLGRKKRPSEKFPIGVDMTSELQPGDALVTSTVTAWDGVNNVTATLLESPVLSSTVTSATIKNGTDGKTYRINFLATSAAGNIFEHDINVTVSATA